MNVIHRVRVLPLVPPLLAAQPVEPESPERGIVAVEFAVPLCDGKSEPGPLSGQRIMGGPRGALDLVRGEVPEAACPGLETLAGELRQLDRGDGPEPPLPKPERAGDLPAKTQRIDWLPVRCTARLQAHEDRHEPSLHRRQDLALALRKPLVPATGPHQEEARR